MGTQELKILPEYFNAVIAKKKTFEVRSTEDRSFRLGEVIWLKEFDPAMGYTGRECAVQVTYILEGVIYQNKPAVVMSIEVQIKKEIKT